MTYLSALGAYWNKYGTRKHVNNKKDIGQGDRNHNLISVEKLYWK